MPESSELTTLAAAAADAAGRDDTPAAAEFLRRLLDAQTAALGPDHPDLATTLNNLALMLERLGQMPEAGRCYGRAHHIANRALGPDDPQVQVSHANLTAFLATYRLPADGGGGPWEELTDFAPAGIVAPERETSTPAPPPTPQSPPGLAPPVAVAALILLVLLGGVAAWMLWPTPGVLPAASAVEPPAASPVEPPATSRAEPATGAVEPAPSRVEPPAANAVESAARITEPAASGIRVVTADVCRNLTSSGGWRCTPVSEDVPTRVAFYYTRIATPRNAVVHHRWSRDGTVVRTVDLRVSANNVEGYRTFSRQTMTAGDAGSWEVALVTGEGTVLDRQRFGVP